MRKVYETLGASGERKSLKVECDGHGKHYEAEIDTLENQTSDTFDFRMYSEPSRNQDKDVYADDADVLDADVKETADRFGLNFLRNRCAECEVSGMHYHYQHNRNDAQQLDVALTYTHYGQEYECIIDVAIAVGDALCLQR